MKFKNLGLIFDVTDFAPLANYTHAQSPQLYRIGNLNRVYFSTRPPVSRGEMPTTEVFYVDYDSEFHEIVSYSRTSVVEPAILGAYDEHGIFPFHVTKIDNRLLGYISGWSRRDSVAVETSIGISESFDNGVTFQRIGNGPILTASLNEPFLVGDPFIVSNDGKHFMYYIAGTEWKKAQDELDLQRVYKIRIAVSNDCENWIPFEKNVIENLLGADECQALPSVVYSREKSIMAFCYREMSNFRRNGRGAYRLGFAESNDLINWNRDDSLIEIPNHPDEWDSGMRCYPNITEIDGKLVILYNGNDFGRKGFGLAIEE